MRHNNRKRKTILFTIILFAIYFSTSLLYSQNIEKDIDPKKQEENINKKTADNKKDKSSNDPEDKIDIEDTKSENDTKSEKDGEESSEKSLFATVKHGGPLMIFIALLGIISMTIIIERLIYFTRNKSWNEKQVIADISKIAKRSNSFYMEELEDELRSDFQIYANELERGMSLLSGIGNLSPIVGFLGTVIGMIDAFASIVAATTVNAKVVASGIQIALVTTAGGLLVAAPTLAFFYLFSHVIQRRYANADEIIGKLSEKLPRLSESLRPEKKKAPAAKKGTIKKTTGTKNKSIKKVKKK